ncbi:MAG: 16S rRNA (adenine(1518)-N(6)/adenine(1519)-N(6))-dimethyltransferase RsmA [Ruminococcaceae bacterium]|nr:16S rRNA (adenine(1518)-N(6)/adenine(1519)-N(6))-dimethyltransferase RsmA [Oscillospiraceae bacterium]
MNLCDIKTIRQLMAMFSLNFRKEFGQNFLTDNMVVEDIADSCCDDAESTILEIGPGAGSLTKELALRYKNVIAVEIDNGLIPLLKYTLDEFKNVSVVNGDIMKTDLSALLSDSFAEGRVSVCANLPYYITTPIMMMLLESGLPFDYITIMIQSEVADRLCANAGNKAYGAITAVLNYYGTAEKLFVVKSDRFVPEPKVDSTVIRIKLHKEKPYRPLDEATFFRTIRAAFEQRRKTLPNALSAVFTELSKDEITAIITEKCALPADIRGERLDTAQFTALSDELFRAISGLTK